VRANRAYHLIVSRDGPEPAFIADPARLDRIEVVSIDDGEVVLYWSVNARLASRLLKQLREDLVALDSEAFIDKWIGADAEDLF
jgi:hypothetical protein